MTAKDTLFSAKNTPENSFIDWIREKPRIMGIINITPDSFYEGSRKQSVDDALKKAAEMIEAGADIIDIGGYSTRPGADDIDPEEEMKRVVPVIEKIRKSYPEQIISIDTFRVSVANEALKSGANIINDVSGGLQDKGMYDFVAENNVPYILMHMRGNPKNMKNLTEYDDLVSDVFKYLDEKTTSLKKKGAKKIIIDPGLGFAKTIDQNFTLLKKLSTFKQLGQPVMIGLSRKSMIYKTLNTTPSEALNGTTALHMAALMNGANILRVHDVAEAKETVTLFEKLSK